MKTFGYFSLLIEFLSVLALSVLAGTAFYLYIIKGLDCPFI